MQKIIEMVSKLIILQWIELDSASCLKKFESRLFRDCLNMIRQKMFCVLLSFCHFVFVIKATKSVWDKISSRFKRVGVFSKVVDHKHIQKFCSRSLPLWNFEGSKHKIEYRRAEVKEKWMLFFQLCFIFFYYAKLKDLVQNILKTPHFYYHVLIYYVFTFFFFYPKIYEGCLKKP